MHHRLKERDLLKRKLSNGVSIHMPAPRRIGKTWTINRLAGDLRKDGWVTVEVDVQGLRTPEDFARELCNRIQSQLPAKSSFKAHLSKRLALLTGGGWEGNPLEALGRLDPVEFLETLIEALNLSSERSAIFVDEIAYFFLKCAEDDKEKAHDFAYRLRALLKHKKVRWLLTGSIGLNNIARQYDFEGAFVDFETFTLHPFTADEARSYLRDNAVQQQLNHMFDASDEDFDSMFAELGWLAPFYLKLVGNEVRPSHSVSSDTLPTATSLDFEAAFNRLLQPNRQSEFAVWVEHIKKNFPASSAEIAMKVLHKVSLDSDGETLDTIIAIAAQVNKSVNRGQVKGILAMLLNDGLLAQSGNRYRFTSGLVRRYWKEYEAQ